MVQQNKPFKDFTVCFFLTLIVQTTHFFIKKIIISCSPYLDEGIHLLWLKLTWLVEMLQKGWRTFEIGCTTKSWFRCGFVCVCVCVCILCTPVVHGGEIRRGESVVVRNTMTLLTFSVTMGPWRQGFAVRNPNLLLIWPSDGQGQQSTHTHTHAHTDSPQTS